MLVIFEDTATPEMIQKACREMERMGLQARTAGSDRLASVTAFNGVDEQTAARLKALRGVRDVRFSAKGTTLTDRTYHAQDSVVSLGDVRFGDDSFSVIAGPCSIESRDQAMSLAEKVAAAGARMFRGGAFKPRTSPYSFQGLGHEALTVLDEVRSTFGLSIITEALDIDVLSEVAEVADIIQIGSRNMQNFSLLRRAGQINKPVLLKRGLAATIDEFLLAAEYILLEGNQQVILCERGVRMVANQPGNLFDLSSVLDIKRRSHLPIIADPSHAAEDSRKVAPLSRAALAVGAHALMVEVHEEPSAALSDGRQALTPDQFTQLMDELRRLAVALNRTFI